MNKITKTNIHLKTPVIRHQTSSWIQHIPFGYHVVAHQKPAVVVELGTHYGCSFFTFCETVQSLNYHTKCFAVDTWKGDKHVGTLEPEVFHWVRETNKQFSDFSRLLRMTFNDALPLFEDKSIDLLHIDGLHTYEAVKEDFTNWLPKMSAKGIILMHDTRVLRGGFGVWNFFEEVKSQYPTYEFVHGHGLGVVFTGPEIQAHFAALLNEEELLQDHIALFSSLGKLREYEILNENLKTERPYLSSLEHLSVQLHQLHEKFDHLQQTTILSKNAHLEKTEVPEDKVNDEVSDSLEKVNDLQTITAEQKELIKNSGLFDERFYILENVDVAESGIDPLAHFLLYGGAEGRAPSPLFSSKKYLLDNPEIKAAGINPLIHYLEKKRDKSSNKDTFQVYSDNPLLDYFIHNKDRIIHKWFHFFDIYHQHFQHLIDKECVIVEIGVFQGGSLQMWKNYFGKKARIYGIDINPECKKFEEDQIEIFIGSQSDGSFLESLKKEIPKIDLLIDDGSHRSSDIIRTFQHMRDHLKDEAIYVIEDTYCSYFPDYEGGYLKENSFIEFSKTLIDIVNLQAFQEQAEALESFKNHSYSIHFHDNLFILKQTNQQERWHEMRGYSNEKISFYPDNSINLMKIKLMGIEIPANMPESFCTNHPEVLKNYFPSSFIGKSRPLKGTTMIGYYRLTNLENCINQIFEHNIPGDFIETGVWKGGASIFMRYLLQQYQNTYRKVWVADSFQGLPAPNIESYPQDTDNHLFEDVSLAISLDLVKKNFSEFDLLDDQVRFLVGWFKDTLPNAPIEKLALMRLDGDMYESTFDSLFNLYHKLSVGGFCIIDDWGAFSECKKAVLDFREVYQINESIIEIDWTGVYWKKEKDITPLSREEYFSKLGKK